MGFLSVLFPPSLTPQEAQDSLARREAVALDVRERHEWKAGHIPGSKNIPLSSLHSRVGELPGSRRYIAVCRSGARSRSAVSHLRGAGFDVINLKGGMLGWSRAGLPLEPRNGKVR